MCDSNDGLEKERAVLTVVKERAVCNASAAKELNECNPKQFCVMQKFTHFWCGDARLTQDS
eukprot:8509551-Ditylum_brightwellii.AAC.2